MVRRLGFSWGQDSSFQVAACNKSKLHSLNYIWDLMSGSCQVVLKLKLMLGRDTMMWPPATLSHFVKEEIEN